jgi:hypothetical protein
MHAAQAVRADVPRVLDPHHGGDALPGYPRAESTHRPKDDRSIILFFSQLAEQLDDTSAKVVELIDAECRELLGLAGTWIFSNLQRLRPNLDLEEVLQRRAPPPPGTPNSAA